MLDIFLHHLELLVKDVVALDELNCCRISVLLKVTCSLTTQLKSDVFRQYLKIIKLLSDSFLSTDASIKHEEVF